MNSKYLLIKLKHRQGKDKNIVLIFNFIEVVCVDPGNCLESASVRVLYIHTKRYYCKTEIGRSNSLSVDKGNKSDKSDKKNKCN